MAKVQAWEDIKPSEKTAVIKTNMLKDNRIPVHQKKILYPNG